MVLFILFYLPDPSGNIALSNDKWNIKNQKSFSLLEQRQIL